MKICYNNDKEDLYCIECKSSIEIGERYVVVEEEYLGEKIRKEYHLEHAPVESEEDEIAILENE